MLAVPRYFLTKQPNHAYIAAVLFTRAVGLRLMIERMSFMLQIRGPLLPERLILQKDMENILRQAVEEESDLAGIHFEGGVVPTETLRIISLKECRFTSCRFGECKGEQLYFFNVVFESCDFASSFLIVACFAAFSLPIVSCRALIFLIPPSNNVFLKTVRHGWQPFPGQNVRKYFFGMRSFPFQSARIQVNENSI